MSKRPSADITRAISRLRTEEQVPLGDLAGRPVEFGGVEVRPTATVLLRWGREGKRGVYLDVLFCTTRAAWVTSRQAVARFQQELVEAGVQFTPLRMVGDKTSQPSKRHLRQFRRLGSR